MKNKFKKFGGDWIPDIVEYMKEYVKHNPDVTISVGCDSVQKKRRTIYANTIMLHNKDIRNGAHVVFYRQSLKKIYNTNLRLYKEAEYAYNISEMLNDKLQGFYERKDLDEYALKLYKYHIGYCNGDYEFVKNHNIERFVDNISLTEYEKTKKYKLVDIHLDFNPREGLLGHNKSYAAYKNYVVSWLRNLDYRVYAKNLAYAASSAADLLLKK